MRAISFTALNGKVRTITIGGRRNRPVLRNHADTMENRSSLTYYMNQQCVRISRMLERNEQAERTAQWDHMGAFHNRQETTIERRG